MTAPVNSLIERQDWIVGALCAQTDPDAFHPGDGEPLTPAKRICQDCPVVWDCLAYALDAGERLGVWGGTTPEERKQMQKKGGAHDGR